MKNATVGIHFGALCDSIESQLEKQGLKFETQEVKRFDRQADAIITLHFADILTDSMTDVCRKRLFKEIEKHIKETNP